MILGQLQHLLLHLILFWEKLYRNPIEGILEATNLSYQGDQVDLGEGPPKDGLVEVR